MRIELLDALLADGPRRVIVENVASYETRRLATKWSVSGMLCAKPGGRYRVDGGIGNYVEFVGPVVHSVIDGQTPIVVLY